jgi:hypothetical protein
MFCPLARDDGEPWAVWLEVEGVLGLNEPPEEDVDEGGRGRVDATAALNILLGLGGVAGAALLDAPSFVRALLVGLGEFAPFGGLSAFKAALEGKGLIGRSAFPVSGFESTSSPSLSSVSSEMLERLRLRAAFVLLPEVLSSGGFCKIAALGRYLGKPEEVLGRGRRVDGLSVGCLELSSKDSL